MGDNNSVQFFSKPAGIVASELVRIQAYFNETNVGRCTFEVLDAYDTACLGELALFSDETPPGVFVTYKRGRYRSVILKTGKQDGMPTCIRLKRIWPPHEGMTRNRGRICEILGINDLQRGRASLENVDGRWILSFLTH